LITATGELSNGYLAQIFLLANDRVFIW